MKEESTFTSNLFYPEFLFTAYDTDSYADWFLMTTTSEFNSRTVHCSLVTARTASRILATLVYHNAYTLSVSVCLLQFVLIISCCCD